MKSATRNLNLYRRKLTNKCFHEVLNDKVKLTLMLIPGGTFVMGAPESEPESRNNERPQHQVSVLSFLMGRYPVTQAQWRVVASYEKFERDLNPDPSRFKGDERPVEQVSWDDAQEFCQRLSRKTARVYRLPSEAEWEYACRAGTKTPFHFGEIISDEVANYFASGVYNGSPKGQHKGETTEVGVFPANQWGLCDMHGNVLEWCEDNWYDNYDGAPTDGKPWLETMEAGNTKVLRGGSWYFLPRLCRSACRYFFSRDVRVVNFGFRVCCEPPRTLALGS